MKLLDRYSWSSKGAGLCEPSGRSTCVAAKGLAQALLIRSLRDVRKRGERVTWLDTFEEYQTRAVDLYRSLGFYVAKEFPRYRKSAG